MPQQRTGLDHSAPAPQSAAPQQPHHPEGRTPTPEESAAMTVEAVRNTTRVHRRMTGKRARRQQERNAALVPRQR